MMRAVSLKTWVALALFGGSLALAQDKKAGDPKMAGSESKLPNCPVMGDTIDFGVSTMTDSGPVYFCCEDCIKKYKAEPAKYESKVKQQRETLAKMDRVQVKCPMSGEPVDAKVSAEIDGKKVMFCCKDCIAKYKADPAKYSAKMAASYTYQTKCPVSGEKIDATVHAEMDGRTVYFCCEKCIGKFKADPAKYSKKLMDQGVIVNPANCSDSAAHEKSKDDKPAAKP